jgi:hypothetical protein
VADASVASYEFTGLAHGTAYDFLVVPVDAAGISPTNNGYTDWVTDFAPPNAPAISSVAPVNDGTVTKLAVTWSASATDSTHYAATSYNLRYSVHAANSWTTVSGVTSGTVVTGLTIGTSYDIEVQGANASTTSPRVWSSATTASTYASVVTWSASGEPLSTQSRSTTNVLGVVFTEGMNAATSPQASSVSFAMPTGNTVVPVSGLVSGTYTNPTFAWAVFYPVPANGTYYFWAIAYDSRGDVIGALVSGAVTASA